MATHKQSVTFNSHTSMKLGNGTFLFLPGLLSSEAQAARKARSGREGSEPRPQPLEDGPVRQLTIKSVDNAHSLVGTQMGQTLHITLPSEDFARLRHALADARLAAKEATKLTFEVDDDGDVTHVYLNDEELCPELPA